MKLLDRVRAYLTARQRRFDVEVLWPTCVDQAANLDEARLIFALHASGDSAWLSLPPEELTRQIEELRDPRDGTWGPMTGPEYISMIKRQGFDKIPPR